MSRGRDSERPVNSSIRRRRCRTVFGMTEDLRRGVVSGAALLQPRLERVEQDCALGGRQFFQSP